MSQSSVRGSTVDPFNLNRFVEAQADSYEDALRELTAGAKRTHWIWFVFPQIAGLGTSLTARSFAISGAAEATKYLEHPVLGPRLIECTRIVNGLQGRTAMEIFGTPDDLKFCSSMTLFETVGGKNSEFAAAIERFYGGRRDSATLELLRA